MTKKEIREIALRQSAIDCGCAPGDFLRSEPVVVRSRADERARKYLPLPFECDLVSYGNNVVAQVSERLRTPVEQFLRTYPASHCFETPHLHALEDLLRPFGLRVCFQAEYFLPEPDLLRPLPSPYPMRLLTPTAFDALYVPEWSNALCKERRQLDRLAVGAYDGETLIGLAGASADCETMWQIGVDVLPPYRRRGVASALVSRLACEILARGIVPFYCAAWCNLPSVRNAIRCGFCPAWVELTAREASLVEQLNGKN